MENVLIGYLVFCFITIFIGQHLAFKSGKKKRNREISDITLKKVCDLISETNTTEELTKVMEEVSKLGSFLMNTEVVSICEFTDFVAEHIKRQTIHIKIEEFKASTRKLYQKKQEFEKAIENHKKIGRKLKVKTTKAKK